MPVSVRKYGTKYAVQEKGAKGKPPAARTHASRAAAVKQAQAINISMGKRGAFGPKVKAKLSKKKK